MEAKKKAHLKLEKNSSLYFVIGLTLILALIYTALEWKTFDLEPDWHTSLLNGPEELDPEIPPVTFNTPPPLPPVIPTVIEVAPDDDPDIIETVIKPTDTDQSKEILEPETTHFHEPEPEIDEVPFMVIENVPVFPGCEGADDKRACFQEKMQKHIRKNFKYPESAITIGLEGRISTQFIIGKDGAIENVKIRGPHQILESEVLRIISKLPRMEPGKQRGKAVKVSFSIPITFRLQ